jgi:hypothetical protein
MSPKGNRVVQRDPEFGLAAESFSERLAELIPSKTVPSSILCTYPSGELELDDPAWPPTSASST